ncbi:TapY2 family type IVa secretion system protein [Colwellia sp. E2M01]|uniref:TapY2 family type IVa secretion system protein n=1 Tax=Colwellia sp. E2M01 TaxID=2841561 RepID=UPI001C08FF61|nr:TapY2 family type IVa secretion system protein [Colwellia sp. E2M01]MBU2869397.1 TapY2 family type IVa secretion system protein [Colwellia sp. E2M01]
MKNLMILTSCVVLITFSSFNVIAFSPNNEDKKSNSSERLSVKCHVTLIDGNETISLWRLSPEEYSILKESAVGKYVTPHSSNKEVKISKVNECALESEKFTAFSAKQLDKKLPR